MYRFGCAAAFAKEFIDGILTLHEIHIGQFNTPKNGRQFSQKIAPFGRVNAEY